MPSAEDELALILSSMLITAIGTPLAQDCFGTWQIDATDLTTHHVLRYVWSSLLLPLTDTRTILALEPGHDDDAEQD